MDISSLNSYSKTTLPAAHSGAGASTPTVASDSSTAATQQKSAQPSSQEVQNAAKQLTKAADASASSLEFSVDSATDQTVVKVVDKATGDVIRQIPSKEALNLAQSINQALGGVILRDKA